MWDFIRQLLKDNISCHSKQIRSVSPDVKATFTPRAERKRDGEAEADNLLVPF